MEFDKHSNRYLFVNTVAVGLCARGRPCGPEWKQRTTSRKLNETIQLIDKMILHIVFSSCLPRSRWKRAADEQSLSRTTILIESLNISLNKQPDINLIVFPIRVFKYKHKCYTDRYVFISHASFSHWLLSFRWFLLIIRCVICNFQSSRKWNFHFGLIGWLFGIVHWYECTNDKY